ncbi:MAG: helix-turn-helix transcriptional regulator [Cyanobacteria bacterium J06555_3]
MAMITEISMSYYLDVKRFAELVRFHRGDRSLREIAKITGISASTIGRVEKEQTPDMDTFFALCDWLNIPAHRLIENTEETSKSNKAQSICTKLRSDSRLNPEVADGLAVLIEAAYSGTLRIQ